MKDSQPVIGLFADRARARRAIAELQRAGYGEAEIGVTARDIGVTARDDASRDSRGVPDDNDKETHAREGAVTGLTVGAGVGALWGLTVLAGLLPAIGPAIAGGTLAALLPSAAAGAATAGVAGALIGLGIPEKDAKFYEDEFRQGRVLVTVRADSRRAAAMSILQRFGGYDMQTRGRSAGSEMASDTMELSEEQLHARKRSSREGEAGVRKPS